MAQTANSATATRRSTAAKKAATSRARTKAATARNRKVAGTKAAETPKTPIDVAQVYAERAVLIPIGAALEARDRVVTSVNEAIETVSTRSKAETQLKRFERRGNRARN